MSQDKQHIFRELGDHPSLELLQQYHDGKVSSHLVHKLEHHLLDCAMCSDLLEGMDLSETPETDAAERDLNKWIAATFQGKKRKGIPVTISNWQVAATIVLLLCSAVLVFYYKYQDLKPQENRLATESAIEKTMDLGEKPASAAIEKLTDATPDTIPQSIASSTSPPAPVKSIFHTSPQLISEPESNPKTEEIIKEEVIADTEIAAGVPIKEIENSLSEVSIPEQVKVNENIGVERALMGKVAGVSLRGANSVARKQVQGQVLSSDGSPLPGVSVIVKGTTNAVATDAQGNFTLSVPTEKAVLSFSYLGYENKEKAIDTSTDQLIVNLEEDSRSLSEVVVTGYGAERSKPPVLADAKPGIGMQAYRKYLRDSLRYAGISEKGRVVVQATVSPTGKLQNLKVIRSLCPACDKEALRLIQEGPDWKPATRNDFNIEQEVKIVVRFRLGN